jgi:hypothetical protein
MFAFELTVCGADGVGMEAEAPRQFARAGQALAGSQIVAEDGQNNLSHELFANGDFAAARKRELHAGLS